MLNCHVAMHACMAQVSRARHGSAHGNTGMKISLALCDARPMPKALALLALGIVLLAPNQVMAQSDSPVAIASPADGDVLTGVVEIRGTVPAGNFLSASLAFSYDGMTESQWFNIADIPGPVNGDRLALWDTGAISDGAYSLRLRLNGTDGTVQDATIRVQVRNYTVAPTATALTTPTALLVLRIPTPVLASTTVAARRIQADTPTPLPPNPARISEADLMAGFARGGLAVLALFLLWGAVGIRRHL
jgi:hypothetical protein